MLSLLPQTPQLKGKGTKPGCPHKSRESRAGSSRNPAGTMRRAGEQVGLLLLFCLMIVIHRGAQDSSFPVLKALGLDGNNTLAIVRGSPGLPGAQGPRGPPGIQGAKGEKGDPGTIDEKSLEALQCQRGAPNCKELLKRGVVLSGWYTIYPQDCQPLKVLCDMDTDGGGWIVSLAEDGSVVARWQLMELAAESDSSDEVVQEPGPGLEAEEDPEKGSASRAERWGQGRLAVSSCLRVQTAVMGESLWNRFPPAHVQS